MPGIQSKRKDYLSSLERSELFSGDLNKAKQSGASEHPSVASYIMWGILGPLWGYITRIK